MLTKYTLLLTLLSFAVLLAACDSSSQAQQPAAASEQEGTLAVVEGVSIEELMDHQYAVVAGNYPNSCARISNVEQAVQGTIFNIALYTEQPADLMCAQMITPFTVNILLEVGGLSPGDYSVNVNDSVSTTLTVGG